MIVLTRRQVLQLSTVYNNLSLGLPRWSESSPLLRFHVDRQHPGLQVRLVQPTFAVQGVIPGTPRPAETVLLPMRALPDLAARADTPVVLLRQGDSTLTYSGDFQLWGWKLAAQPVSFPVPSRRKIRPFPGEPNQWTDAPHELRCTLRSATLGNLHPHARLALRSQGRPIRGDGGTEHAMPEGFGWPWAGDRTVAGAQILASLPEADFMAVGEVPGYVVMRFDLWTVWLAVQSEATNG